MRKPLITIFTVLGVCGLLLAAPAANKEAARFDTLLKKAQTDPSGTTEAEVMELLDLARKQGRSYTASLGIRTYLSHHFRPSPGLLQATAEAAFEAGDYTMAVTRHKNYLAVAKPSQEASRAAANLYTLLVDFLGAEDDAYQFMSKEGEKFRSHAAARRFDSWYLNRARSHNDHVAVARTLAAALADRLPIEQERLYYGSYLDWLMSEISAAGSRHYAALPHCRKIVPLVRDDKLRQLRYALCVSRLAFRAGSAGKEDAALARDFELVARAAQDYLNASPTARTLQDIVEVIGGGAGHFSESAWNEQADQKQKLFVAAFEKLSDAERAEFLAWHDGSWGRHFATRQQWADLGAKHAQLFAKCPAAANLPFLTQAESLDDYKKQVAFLQGTASRDAAVINSMATGDINRAIDHLMTRESWHLPLDGYRDLMEGEILPSFERLAKAEKKELPDDFRDKAWVYLGSKYLANSPAAIYDIEAVKRYLNAAWQASGKDKDDKSQVARHLLALQWVPFVDSRARRSVRLDIFNSVYDSFRGWAENLRREARKNQKGQKPVVDPALLDLIEPIQQAFRDVRAQVDPAKAPNPLCKAMAAAMIAEQTKGARHPDLIKAQRDVYALVKDYDARKTPYGRDTYRQIISSRGGDFTNFDFQLEMLADQLAMYKPGGPEERLDRLVSDIFTDRHDFRPWESQLRYKTQVLKVNAVFAKDLLGRVGRGELPAKLFDYFRSTRMGRGWTGGDVAQDIMDAVIAKRLFHKTGYRPTDSTRCATTSYMRLIRYEFPGLSKKYPVESYFDDLFVEEARQTGFLDWTYWEYGQDQKKKVATAAAKMLVGLDRLPLGYNGEKVVYDPAELNRWQEVALRADAASREALLAKMESSYGKGRFDVHAMGYGAFALADTKTPAGRKAFFEKLATYIDRAAAAPGRVGMPYLGGLANVSAKNLTDPELAVLIQMFVKAPAPWWAKGSYFDAAVYLVHDGLVARKRVAELFPLVGHFWKVARDTEDGSMARKLADLADDLRKTRESSLALAYSTVGMEMLKTTLSGETRTALGGVRSSAWTELGGVIPVSAGHPLYDLYKAQLAYLTGRYQTAWEAYLVNRDKLLRSFKEFDPQFCIWMVDKNTEFKDFDAAETLARELLTWFDEVSERFDAEVRARLQLSYGNIALAREDYPRARALFERIVANKDFAGARAQLDAELSIADVDTQTGNYDRAIERLEGLTRRSDKYLQSQAYYHLAMVKYAQEEYTEAKDRLDQVFDLTPDHAEARILEGKVNLKLKKLEQPTDIELGEKIGKKYIVPGKPVRVTLVDRNLSIVRKAGQIEIRAWTDSGDEEFFLLAPFGDSKIKFKGQIATELGAVKKGDHVIQVIGSDRVHYAFSPKFAEVQKLVSNEPFTLAVATDAELYVSSGRILSKEEREAQALEDLIRRKLGTATKVEDKAVPLSTVRQATQIKPGNKFTVRVVDADRGETNKPDTISVRIASSSGDSIESFTVTETGPHTGVFEGAAPTESAQAMAYASDSQEGTEANFAISAKKYPAWVGLPKPSLSRPKTFSVDLNDNVALGTMKLVADVPTRRLKSFLVQTSLNGLTYTTVGGWPDKFVPWDGQPRIELARYVTEAEKVVAPKAVPEFADYLEQGYIRYGQKKVVGRAKSLTVNWNWTVDGYGERMGLDGAKDRAKHYVAHISTAFYQPRRQIRTFTLQPKGVLPAAGAGRRDTSLEPTYLITVDGQGPESSLGQGQPAGKEETGITVKQALGKGVHRLDIYVFADQRASAGFEVTCDTDKPPYVIPCPMEMFDIAKHPEITRGLPQEVAAVTGDKDNSTFDIAFPAGSRARIVRLLLTDFETDAPAISRITLADGAGKPILPTKHDFMDLRKNDTLEIVPGDRVTVTYLDPKVLTRGKEQHEAFLTATYTNAEISACFVEYAPGAGAAGEHKADYISMRRFDAGDKINVFINDPDSDVSDKLDTVRFTARTSEGQPIELAALETEEHSGIFLGAVFPIQGQPKRNSEMSVKEGDDVILTYLDRENTDPGIPWNRTAVVEQVWFEPPELRVYDVTSMTLEEADKLAGRSPGAAKAPKPKAGAGGKDIDLMAVESVEPRRTLLAVRPEKADAAGSAHLVIGGPLLVELLFPAAAKSPASTCSLYAQTSTGRKKYGKAIPDGTFDINVPGTLKLTVRPGDMPTVAPPPGYREVTVRSNPYALTALDDGRFCFNVPIRLGPVPDKPLAAIEDKPASGPKLEGEDERALFINGDDEIYLGLSYKDEQDKEHWATRKAVLSGDFFFDVMDRRYQEQVAGLYVGENLYFRVIDPTRDATDEKDMIEVDLVTKSGKASKLQLIETFTHSGVFKGLATVVYAEDKAALKEIGAVGALYGDAIAAKYLQPKNRQSSEYLIDVFKGANGEVVPFTKRFKDPGIAVQTQFMIAEAYFELAKRHRQLKQDSLARREIEQGRKLLEEAIRDYPDTQARAQAEYLLADLSLEFGNDAVNEDIRKKYFNDAIARYGDIVASYPDSEYAPKSQFRKALAFEKMEMLDEACEEYVKLSYRYPDNPLVAETIARLGQYFLNKGRAVRDEAEKETDPVKKEKVRLSATDMFKTAGQVFGRLSVRFPNHRLSGKTLLLSAQCFMQAEDFPSAIKGYDKVIKTPDTDNELVSEAMYWCGHSYMETSDLVHAYQMFKKLTWDYPASKWAKFARGRLADEKLANIQD